MGGKGILSFNNHPMANATTPSCIRSTYLVKHDCGLPAKCDHGIDDPVRRGGLNDDELPREYWERVRAADERVVEEYFHGGPQGEDDDLGDGGHGDHDAGAEAVLGVGRQGEGLDGEGLAAAAGEYAAGRETSAPCPAKHPLERYLKDGNIPT